MGHYGEKDVTFKDKVNDDIVGLKFQVTDVRKPLLAVRRLVERGNVVRAGAGAELHHARGERPQDHDGEEGRVRRDQGEVRAEGRGGYVGFYPAGQVSQEVRAVRPKWICGTEGVDWGGWQRRLG